MADDPLGFFATEAAPRNNDSTANKTAFSTSGVGAADDALKKADFDKWAAKGGSKTTAKKDKTVEVTSTNKSGNRTSVFGDSIFLDEPISSKERNAVGGGTDKLNAALDVLEQAAQKDQQSSASSALEDSLFGDARAAPASAPGDALPKGVQKGARLRELNETEDKTISDLKLTSALVEKEDDTSMKFDVFGRTTIDASGNTIKPNATEISLGDRKEIDEASAQLSELDLLSNNAHIETEEEVRKKKLESAAAAAAALSSSSLFSAPTEPVVDVDMASLDLDAYLAANSGETEGGGLFD